MDRAELYRRYQAVEIATQALAAADQSYQEALAAIRKDCPHTGAVVEMRLNKGMVIVGQAVSIKVLARFCLECGLLELAPAYQSMDEHAFTIMWRASRVFLKDFGSDGTGFLAAFRCYDQRLRAHGRSDEFDVHGAWTGISNQATPTMTESP